MQKILVRTARAGAVLFFTILNMESVQALVLTEPMKIDQGWIQGIDRGNTVEYRGIPYASQPVGDLRWRAPGEPPPFDGIFQAIKAGPISIQPSPFSKTKTVGSEASLYLNVHAPKDAKGRNLPVLVWFHGGAFIFGDGIQKIGPIELYDALALVEKGDMIVVTGNYRLGAMGFLAHPKLALENKDRSTGNYGIQDQIAILKWVHRNIRYWGGDPQKTTAAGESAGGDSVEVLATIDEAKGLFKRIIPMSAPFMERTLAQAFGTGRRLAKRYGRTDKLGRSIPASMDELRNIPAERIVLENPMQLVTMEASLESMDVWAPVIDGHTIKRPIFETVRRGLHNVVDVLSGTMKHEMNTLSVFFLSGLPFHFTDAEYRKILTVMYGEETAERAMKVYTRKEYKTNRRAFIALLGDTTFHSPAFEFAQAMDRANPGSVYRYMMSQEVGLFGAGHGMDLLYLFPGRYLLPSHRWLSDLFIRMVARFVHTGNPNHPNGHGGDPYWPSVREGGILELNSKGTKVIDEFRGEQMEHWSSTTRLNNVNVGARCESLFMP